MNFKDIIKKEFLFEESSSSSNATLKIFYKIDIDLIKKKEVPVQEVPQQEVPVQEPEQVVAPEVSAEIPQQVPVQEPEQQIEPEFSQNDLDVLAKSSVVTEDDKKITDDDNEIVRKIEGEIVVTKDQIDTTQTVDDLLDILSKEKNNGDVVLDEFSLEVIQTLLLDNIGQKINDLIDKKSYIYIDIIYGKKKDDSVGIRIIKRKNSDSVSNMLMVDNELINTRFNINTVNDRIIQSRNSFFDKK